MPVWLIAIAVDHLALFVQRSLLVDVVGAVQIGDILGDHNALRILPRTLADAVARIDRGLAVNRLCREIGVPGLASGTRSLRQCRTLAIRALQTAEVGAFSRSNAR